MNQEVQFQYDEIDLMDIFRTLKNSWKLIITLFLVTVFTVGSVTYFFMPKKYLSKTLFYLQAEGKFASNFGDFNMIKDVIYSNQFLKKVLEVSELSTTQGTIDILRGLISIEKTSADNIQLRIIWDDPQKAYDILNVVYGRYQVETATSIGVYVTNRLRVAEEHFNRNKDGLDKVNAALADFQKKHNILFLPPQLAVSDKSYSDMKEQLASSPETLAKYEELIAQHSAVKENYIKAYNILENTRQEVEMEKNYLFVTIESPVVPEKKHSPSTVKNTAVAGFLALFFGVLIAFIKKYLRNYKERENTITS